MRDGSNSEHIHVADMTWPSPLLTNLSLKFTMTAETNFSQTETASSLCLELSLMVCPLNSKEQSPEGSSDGEEDRTSVPSLESLSLSSTETVAFRRELTEEKSMSVLLYDNFQFLFN